MVAISFNKQFRAPILARTKRQTLRDERKVPIRAGQPLHLYTGLRTRHARPIGTAECLSYDPIQIDFREGGVRLNHGGLLTFWDSPEELQAFATDDGFLTWDALERFWAKTHPGLEQWEGVRIFWGDTLVPAPDEAQPEPFEGG